MKAPAWFDEDAGEVVASLMRGGALQGLSLAIVFGSERVVRGFGFSDIENEVPALPATVYRIGSLTKQFTAAATMRLVERGALQLDDTLGDIIPEYPAHGHGITIEQLLTHTSGVRNYTSVGAFAERSRLHSTHLQVAQLFAAEPLDFTPGEQYRYSNSGYYLLGIVLERAGGLPYHEFLQRELFTPLGLEQTYYLDNYRIIRHRAQGYDQVDGMTIRAEQISMSVPFSAGALGSTVGDLVAWQEALTHHRLLRASSYERMTTPATLTDGTRTTYGLGVMVGEMRGHRKWSHAGTISGFRAQLAHYPDRRLTIAVLCNNGHAPCELIESRLARHVLGLPERRVEPAAVPPDALDRLVGKYREGDSTWATTRDGSTLRLNGAALVPVDATRFVFADDPDASVSFDDIGLQVERERQRTLAERVVPVA